MEHLKKAYYFGCKNDKGHYLWAENSDITYTKRQEDLPWSIELIDTGLLKNAKVQDWPTGEVFWTCGEAAVFWFSFIWWDRSIDTRGRANSGFYVSGFEYPNVEEAFKYACEQWPDVVSRQKHPLVLQNLPKQSLSLDV